MNFEQALSAVKQGKRATRISWNNGPNMFIYYVPGSVFKVNRPPLLGIYPEGYETQYQAHIDVSMADGSKVPWVVTQPDMLADDWVIITEQP